MAKFREYQNIEIPDFCRAEDGWSDQSWHNDACAKAEKPLVPGQEYPKLRLWVEADDLVEREYEDSPKYALEVVHDESQECDGRASMIYYGGDAAVLTVAVSAWSSAYDKVSQMLFDLAIRATLNKF